MAPDHEEESNIDSDEEADQFINVNSILKPMLNACLVNNFSTWEISKYCCNVYIKLIEPPEKAIKHLA